MEKTLMALLTAGLVLTGCGGGSTTIDTKYDTTTFKDYFLSSGGEIETWNYLNQGAAINTRVLVNLVSGLVDTNEYGEYVPDLAESYTHNDDYTVWTFTLRDGLNWSTRDGEVYAPIVAEDFVTAVEYVLNPDTSSVCYEMATSTLVGAEEYHDGEITDFSEVGVKALDDKTVQFTMKKGVPYFESVLLYSSFMPVNKDFLEEQGDKFGNGPDTILYSGAYLIDEYSNSSEKTFVKNPNYWDAENVELEQIQSIGVKDYESTKELFERGELSYCQLAGTQPTAEERNGNQYMFKSEPYACAYVMFLNNENIDENTQKAINNENFRKALYHGWDRQGYVEMTDPLDPESIYTYTYTSPNSFYTTDGTDYTDLPALAKFNQDYQYDPEAAADYMAKAVEELEAEGVTFPVELQYFYASGNETAAQTAEVLKQTMEEVFPEEVTIVLDTYTQSASTEVYQKNKQALGSAGWIPDYLDPVNVLYTFLSDGYMNNSEDITQGLSHWDISEFVELFEKADAETVDIDKRYNLFAEAEAYLLEHAYVIPLYQAGVQYQMTSYNPYSKTYSLTGGSQYRYKLIDLYDHALTADEVAEMREEWMNERRARGLIQ